MRKIHSRKGSVWIGTSGLLLHGPKETFPEAFQASSRLHYYSTIFNSIEINSTFYKLHKAATFKKWTEDTFGEFRFTVKVWKEITHQKAAVFDVADVRRFVDSLQLMVGMRGCLLLQFPASITIQYFQQLEHIIAALMASAQDEAWRLCVEFRHNSWYCEETSDLLLSAGASMVHHDMPKSKPPFEFQHDAVLYLRFHGPMGDYRGNYSDEMLAEYAELIHEWTDSGKDVFVYFNNSMGNAFDNALQLRKLVESMITLK